jgi:hypothetical protein
MLLLFICSYLGYLYTMALMGAEDVGPFANNDQANNDNDGYRYGGTNYLYGGNSGSGPSQSPYMYQAGERGFSNNQNNNSGGWKPFSGQGHSLS